jgi:hypothetical protein
MVIKHWDAPSVSSIAIPNLFELLVFCAFLAFLVVNLCRTTNHVDTNHSRNWIFLPPLAVWLKLSRSPKHGEAMDSSNSGPETKLYWLVTGDWGESKTDSMKYTAWWFRTMEFYDFPFSWEIQKIPTDELTHIFQGMYNKQSPISP